MNIKSCMKKIYLRFDELFDNKEIYDRHDLILEVIRSTWSDLSIFIKNIDKNGYIYHNKLISEYKIDEYIITRKMVDEARRYLNWLKRNLNDVKGYIMGYFELVETLLIYNDPDDCCSICQGELEYCFSKVEEKIILCCKTCSTWYQYPELIEVVDYDKYNDLEPARRVELRKNNIIRVFP